MRELPAGTVIAVSRGEAHRFSKSPCDSIRLIAGFGVEGDAHAGTTVQHLSRMKRNPKAPNLRQVHLIHGELHDELKVLGFDLLPGQMGENILTRDLDLLHLPAGTRLQIGDDAVIALTGLRNPCHQLDLLHPGLMAATLGRAPDGTTIRKAGVMAIVLNSGVVRPGDLIFPRWPQPPQVPLQPV